MGERGQGSKLGRLIDIAKRAERAGPKPHRGLRVGTGINEAVELASEDGLDLGPKRCLHNRVEYPMSYKATVAVGDLNRLINADSTQDALEEIAPLFGWRIGAEPPFLEDPALGEALENFARVVASAVEPLPVVRL